MKAGIIFITLATILSSLKAATFSFIYTDATGYGYNETDNATPVGGNNGTTLGQQRRNLLEHAANIWAPYLISDVTIVIEADFQNFGGTNTSATLAGATFYNVHANFTGAPLSDTWYVSALANSLSGFDRDPSSPDLYVTINEDVDSNPAVLGGDGFYYGYDHEAGAQIDLLSTLLHEIGHGLGFLSTVDEKDGSYIGSYPDSFTQHMHDEETDKDWSAMSAAERVTSAINAPDLVFNGPATQQASLRQLKPEPSGVALDVIAPAGAVATYTTESSRFGVGLPPWGLTGKLVLVDDDVAPITNACESPFLNAEAIKGNIALIDRGSCNFTVKIKNAQDAGAIAVVMVNNDGDALVSMSGSDPAIIIPSILIGQTNGSALKTKLPNIQIHLRNTNALRGMNNGSLRLYAPDPVESGSTASHWSTDAFPDLLMEPFITDSFLPDLDVTLIALRDIGWSIQNIDLPYLDYELWADENIIAAANAEADDADNDLWSNLAEYALGTNPEDSNDTPAPTVIQRSPSASNGYELFYLRNRLAADIIFDLKQTNDLLVAPKTAENGIDYIIYDSTKLDGQTEQIEVHIESTANKAFYRINVERYSP
jgi:hypothetical protein